MFGICTEGITVPKTIWSISLGLSSQRCTSSETTSFPRSSAVRFRNEVPALTNGVRTPPMMAVRRPVRFVISSLLLAPQLEEEVPGVDPGVVAVAPLQARGISSDRLEVLRPHAGFDLGFANGALPAPLVDASAAGAARAEPLRAEAALRSVGPLDDLDEDDELLVPLAPFPEGGLGEERHVGGGLRSLERCAGESAIAGRARLDLAVRGPRPSGALRRALVGRGGLAEARGR